MTLKELLILLSLLFFALFSRLWRLAEPAWMYFDEPYHLRAAKLLAEGDWRTPFQIPSTAASADFAASAYDWLHPPLAKYIQAIFIWRFGLNAWSWRLPSVIFALLTLVVFYFLVRFLALHFLFSAAKKNRQVNQASNLALLATFFLVLDGLFFVQSRIAMNDVFVLFFTLSAILVYLDYQAKHRLLSLFLSGLLFGLALASKWSAFWILLLLFFKELWSSKSSRQWPFLCFALILTPAMFYLLLYLPMFIQGQDLTAFWLLQKTILRSQLTNPATHLYSSEPLSWVFNLRPVWYFTNQAISGGNWVANIYALNNPLLTFYSLIALIFIWQELIGKKITIARRQTMIFLLALYGISFLPWLFFSRMMFYYHYLLAVPFLMILLAYVCLVFFNSIQDQTKRLAVIFNVLFWPFLVFVLFYPHWTAWPVPQFFAQSLYFFLASWR